MKCFEGARSIIDLTNAQIEEGTVDSTWDSLLTLYASLNALLWSISHPEVRAEHARNEVRDLAAIALEAINVFCDRWPGSSSAVQLYTAIAGACLQSYDVEEETPSPPSSTQFGTPVSLAGPISPESDATPTRQTQPQSATSLFNSSSPFGYVFDPANDPLAAQYNFESDTSPFQHQPNFRSNSIFMSPSTDSNGRRLSHLAPDSNEASAPERMGTTPPPPLMIPKQEPMPPATTAAANSLPTPPESLTAPSGHPIFSQSPRLAATGAQTTPIQTPTLHPISPAPIPHHPPTPMAQFKQQPPQLFPPPHFKQPQPQHQQQPRHQQQTAPAPQRPPPPPTFITPATPSQSHPQPDRQQRPPPPSTDWYNPLPQFVPPHAFSNGMSGGGGGGGNGSAPFWAGAPNPFTGGLGGPNAHVHHQGESQNQTPYGQGHNNGPRMGGVPANTNWNLGWGAGPQEGGSAFTPGHGHGLAPGHVNGGLAAGPGAAGEYYNNNVNDYNSFLNGRHGSLSHEQQLELMDVLETQGMSDIDRFMNLGMGMAGGQGHGHGGHGGHGGVHGHGHGGNGGGVHWG